MKKMRLDRFLSNAGIGSRKEVKSLIKGQRVLVDNNIINDPGYIIDPDKAKVMVDNQPIIYKKFYYLMLISLQE